MSKCEHGLTSAECYVCASPKYAAPCAARSRAMDDSKQVPLHELLLGVPADARLVIDDADGKGTRYIPVGRYCHEAASMLSAAPQQQQGEPTDAMVAAYLRANEEYWRDVDALPSDPTKPWRQGTPKEAVRVGLKAALTASAPQQQAEPVTITDEHIETFVSQYNDVYCHQRKAGVGGGDAERAAMRQVLILALGAYKPRITAAQVEQLKRLADEYAEWSAQYSETFASEYEGPYTRKEAQKAERDARAALHAALDALVKP